MCFGVVDPYSTVTAGMGQRMGTRMSTCTLELNDVGFRYKGGHDALSNVSLRLERGIVGLLGPNGAGKSTLMRILATLAKPTRGRVQWNGDDIASRPDPLRRTLGYLPQDFGVYPMLSAREFLAYLSAVKGISARRAAARVDECLAQVGLADVADRRLGAFSGGMRRKLEINPAAPRHILTVRKAGYRLDRAGIKGLRHRDEDRGEVPEGLVKGADFQKRRVPQI